MRAFSKKLVLEQKTRTSLGAGIQDTSTWSTVATVFASIESRFSGPEFQRQQVFAAGTHIIRHRVTTTYPDTDMRYRYEDEDGTRYFHVEGTFRLEERPRRGGRDGVRRLGNDVLEVFVTERQS